MNTFTPTDHPTDEARAELAARVARFLDGLRRAELVAIDHLVAALGAAPSRSTGTSPSTTRAATGPAESSSPPVTARPYASAATELLAAGWNPIPLPPHRKDLPPRGFTGYDAATVTLDDVELWVATRPRSNVAIRLPVNVIGIDVDQYDDKAGADHLAEIEADLGPLPPTWTSTARPNTRSGIRFYRIPDGLRMISRLSSAIEIVQAHHRYAVVSPSSHPSGREYRWHTPNGAPSPRPPAVDELPELPALWLETLTDPSNRRRRRNTPTTEHHLPAPPEDAGAFIPRLVEQARTLGYVTLTAAELATLLALIDATPHAALSLGPGRIVALRDLVIHETHPETHP